MTTTDSILALVPPPVDGLYRMSEALLADVITQAYKAGGSDAMEVMREAFAEARARQTAKVGE